MICAAIDLKSFYASVECVERGLDPLTAKLVVADERRTEKTICLAVTPALKAYGLSGRCRLFEVVEKAREVKARTGEELTFHIAPPRMRLYMAYSARIYQQVYLKWAAPEDIHVYSIDEVFIDLTKYLPYYGMTAHELVKAMVQDILRLTGITATAGIGSNLYLAKIAMDILAKHVPADADGVRIAHLDEDSYRRQLWAHRPLTDFWRVGRGIARRLEGHGLYTMGDVARCSLTDEELLYREFGIDAELLIDHAWGYESCTMADIHAFEPTTESLSVGQVLSTPYDFDKGRLIVREMADQLVYDLMLRGLLADSVTVTVGYDSADASFTGQLETDRYGRRLPKPAHGTQHITDAAGAPLHTDSAHKLVEAAVAVYDRVVDRRLPVRRMYVVFGNTMTAEQAAASHQPKEQQLDFFSLVPDTETALQQAALEREQQDIAREKKVQQALLGVKEKYGRNAVLRGMNLREGATARERNGQVGGHQG